MKKIRAGIKMALCVSAALGWWGVLYPELVLTTDTCRVCSENEQKEKYTQDGSIPSAGQDIYWGLLGADREDIHFRSRLLEEWNKFMEALNESDQNGAAPQGCANRRL